MTATATPKLDAFVEGTEGQYIDTNGAYGAQSPDLITEYIRAISGREGWQWPRYCTAAAELWDRGEEAMRTAGFLKYRTGKTGDIVVFRQTQESPYGTVGILLHTPAYEDLPRNVGQVFTQNPGAAQPRMMMLNTALGYYRWDEEC